MGFVILTDQGFILNKKLKNDKIVYEVNRG